MSAIHVTRSKTDFADILDTIAAPEIAAELDEAWNIARTSTRINAEPVHQSRDWLLQLLDGFTAEAEVAAASSTAAYKDEVADSATHHAPSADEQAEIAAELKLAPGLSVAELKQIRRTFAMRNHPDRLHEDMRWEATRRMTIANSLIDGLIKAKVAH